MESAPDEEGRVRGAGGVQGTGWGERRKATAQHRVGTGAMTVFY